jgi:hypothetical protein
VTSYVDDLLSFYRAAESFLARQKSITFDRNVRFWRYFF